MFSRIPNLGNLNLLFVFICSKWTNPLNFHEKILRIGGFEKISYFETANLKSSYNYVFQGMGLNSYYYDGLQPKMSAGMIKWHEFSVIIFMFLCDCCQHEQFSCCFSFKR